MKTVVAFLIVLALVTPVLADVGEEYRVRNAGDLVSLCGRDSSAEDYVAALNFCHGYTVGAFAYYHSAAAADPEFEDRLRETALSRAEESHRRFRGLEQDPCILHGCTGGGHVFPVPRRNLPMQMMENEKGAPDMRTMKIIAILMAVLFIATGCAGMSETEKRTGTGAATGAAVGAAVGSLSGSWGWGAAVGAAAGAAGGYIYDQTVKSKDKAYQDGYQAGKQGSPSK